jgi:hypothetical protein
MSEVPIAVGRVTWRVRAGLYAVALLTIGPVFESGLMTLLQQLAR